MTQDTNMDASIVIGGFAAACAILSYLPSASEILENRGPGDPHADACYSHRRTFDMGRLRLMREDVVVILANGVSVVLPQALLAMKPRLHQKKS